MTTADAVSPSAGKEDLRHMPDADVRRRVRGILLEELSPLLPPDHDPLTDGTRFRELGADSMKAVEFRNRVALRLSLRLRSTLIFDHPTLGLLVDHLAVAVKGDAPR